MTSNQPMHALDRRLRERAEQALAAQPPPTASHPLLARLRALGTEPWLDTGNLKEARGLWHRELSALTTNNTLANQAVQTGAFDAQVAEAARTLRASGVAEDALVMELGFHVNCLLALSLVEAFGVFVSVELHPAVAQDVEQTVAYAERYFAICPERFIIKIPLTPAGVCAVARVRRLGIPVNFTLGFSARQNYLAAAVANPTWVNVFLGRLNAVVSDNALGDGKQVGEKATLASQRGLLELRAAGKAQTRQIAASMRSAQQALDLAGVDVYTMPPKVAGDLMKMDLDLTRVTSRVAENPAPQFVAGAPLEKLEVFWAIDEHVRALAEEVRRRGAHTMTGEELRAADLDHGTGLFHAFTPGQVGVIVKDGKIPQLAEWREAPIAWDDLMTQSALQSFTVDQAALDTHLREIAAKA